MTPLSPQSDLLGSEFAVSGNRKIFGKVMTGLVFTCVAISLIPLASILFMVIANGLAGFSPAVFTELPPAAGMQGGGLRNAIIGTFLTCLIGGIISVPFGVLTAIYTIEFSQGNWSLNSSNFVPTSSVACRRSLQGYFPTGSSCY
jgi:phosphate transport system permease protein